MARPYKLREVKGDLNQIIPALVNRHGQAEAGRQLGVSQHTISRWLKENGYKQVIRYEKEEKVS